MGMIDFVVLLAKVLCFVWVAQLILVGARSLERVAKRLLRSISVSQERSRERLLVGRFIHAKLVPDTAGHEHEVRADKIEQPTDLQQKDRSKAISP